MPSSPRAASTRSTRWPPTWVAWASSPRTTRTILHNNSLINLHTIEAARLNGVERYLYTSSACVYPEHLQMDADVTPLREEDAYPANPQDAYGWEKLIIGAALRVLPRRVRPRDARRPLPQHLRALRHVRRRPREGSRRRCAARSLRRSPAARSRSGETASRPARSATSTTASRASTGSCSPTTPSRSTSAPTAWSRSTSSPGS